MAERTHKALVIVAPRAPFEIRDYPTVAPLADEVVVRVKWTASTPLDLHRADGGLLIEPPSIPGCSCAGTVIEVGAEVTSLKIGDSVFGMTGLQTKEMPHQEVVTSPAWCFSKVRLNLI
jgi:NADPH:quinone reductase-like Zn-dependent oxidoreductase